MLALGSGMCRSSLEWVLELKRPEAPSLSFYNCYVEKSTFSCRREALWRERPCRMRGRGQEQSQERDPRLPNWLSHAAPSTQRAQIGSPAIPHGAETSRSPWVPLTSLTHRVISDKRVVFCPQSSEMLCYMAVDNWSRVTDNEMKNTAHLTESFQGPIL